MGRLLLVSNRLPVTATIEHGQLNVRPSSGGLASALGAAHAEGDGLWIGWPGELPRISGPMARALDARLAALRVVPVALTRVEVRGFYEQVSNAVLWPVAHCLLDNLPAELVGWDAYRAANERYADAVVAQYQDGDTIWVHDYHLMLLPALLRERRPLARIGYFHHIPFPPFDVFRVLPWRADLVRGLLGADLIGFHTEDYAAHFMQATGRLLGTAAADGRVHFGGRTIAIGAFPVSVDPAAWTALAATSEARVEAERFYDGLGDARMIVGVDRLDYTKGIVQRLLAFERTLELDPELRDHLRFVQVTVPSRERVRAYASFKRQIDELVGRINGRFGTPHRMPVHRVHGHLDPPALAGLYRAADVLLATPLRDGMNLVAKEFVATREDGNGVLVLSEFAGAAEDLPGALIVNPYDVDALAAAIRRALHMSPNEQRGRMLAMRAQVARFDVRRWTADFLGALSARGEDRGEPLERLDEPSWWGDLPDLADFAVPV